MLKKNKTLLIFIIIGFLLYLLAVFICIFGSLFSIINDLSLPSKTVEMINKHNKSINQLTETLNKKDYVLAKEFFEFDFDHGYILNDGYASGEYFSKKYGWIITSSELPYQDSDYISRIVFVDENDKFIYLFNYTVDEGRAKAYFINRGVIIYPDTKIIKYKAINDGFTVLKFESDDYYDEEYKRLAE